MHWSSWCVNGNGFVYLGGGDLLVFFFSEENWFHAVLEKIKDLIMLQTLLLRGSN